MHTTKEEPKEIPKNENIAYTKENYDKDFKCKENALKHALDIRKFEIELYWKRTTYFWALIAATMAGYLLVQASTISNKSDYSVILVCIGIVFSFGWFYINKGSKQWQENWENHVSMLEDRTIGPLYKVILTRQRPKTLGEKLKQYFIGPGQYSVSKINQLISFCVFLLLCWILIAKSIYIRIDAPVNLVQLMTIIGTILICIVIHVFCRTDTGSYIYSGRKIEATINNNKTKNVC